MPDARILELHRPCESTERFRLEVRAYESAFERLRRENERLAFRLAETEGALQAHRGFVEMAAPVITELILDKTLRETLSEKQAARVAHVIDALKALRS